MTNPLKILGLFVTLLALGAIAAGETQATEEGPYFLAGAKPSLFTGVQNGAKNVFVTSAGTTECELVGWDGGVSATKTQTATLRPGFSKCKLNKETATVKTNNCTFELILSEGSDPPTAHVQLICPLAIDSITIETATCTIHVNETTEKLPHVWFSNTPSDFDVDVQFEVKGLSYTATAGCPGSHALQTNGEFNSEATVEAENINKELVNFEVQ